MKTRFSRDVWALITAGAAFGWSLTWTIWNERQVQGSETAAPAISGSLPGPLTDSASPAPGAPTDWVAPATARSDAAWGFDLFTPPVIFYDRATGRFSVTPPEVAAALAAGAAGSPFGVSLLKVERQSYPLQLVGYAGEAGDFLGIFQNEVTGEAIVARAGHRFDELSLVVRSLEVRREDMIVPDSMPLREIVAVAEVWDESANRVVRLSSSGWQWTDAPVARLRVDATGEERSVRQGDRIETNGARFDVRSVTALPPRLVVGKLHDDGTREEMTLTPGPPVETQLKGDSPFEDP